MILRSLCRVALCIPSSVGELDDYIADPRGRDFLSSQAMTVQQYEREILRPLLRERDTWLRLGVEVYSGVTLATLSQIFAPPSPSLVALVSHWQNGDRPRIELFEGMIAIEEVAAQVHPEFDGFIDLSVCQSLELGMAIRRRAPGSHPKWMNEPTILSSWFSVYSIAFRIMAETDVSYLTALERAIELFKTR
jgi:hypothetical protein